MSCSRVTRENLAWSRRIAEERGLETSLIVSDPLHLKRAMSIAGNRGMTARPSATPTRRFRGLETRLKFLAKETRNLIQYRIFSRFLPLDPPASGMPVPHRPTAGAGDKSTAEG